MDEPNRRSHFFDVKASLSALSYKCFRKASNQFRIELGQWTDDASACSTHWAADKVQVEDLSNWPKFDFNLANSILLSNCGHKFVAKMIKFCEFSEFGAV